MRGPHPQPTYGHPIPRDGKPYIHAKWLSNLLGGDQCAWSAWFRAHYKHKKFETQASELQEWNRDHTALLREIQTRLEENGWHVRLEEQNEFKLRGQTADVAGKPDIIATMPGHVLVLDGKTGRPRDSDWWQVVVYLFAISLARPDLISTYGRPNAIEGEVAYKGRSVRIPIGELTAARRDQIVQLVKVIGGPTAPAKAPSRYECQRCTIGFADCPQRFDESRASDGTPVEAF